MKKLVATFILVFIILLLQSTAQQTKSLNGFSVSVPENQHPDVFVAFGFSPPGGDYKTNVEIAEQMAKTIIQSSVESNINVLRSKKTIEKDENLVEESFTLTSKITFNLYDFPIITEETQVFEDGSVMVKVKGFITKSMKSRENSSAIFNFNEVETLQGDKVIYELFYEAISSDKFIFSSDVKNGLVQSIKPQRVQIPSKKASKSSGLKSITLPDWFINPKSNSSKEGYLYTVSSEAFSIQGKTEDQLPDAYLCAFIKAQSSMSDLLELKIAQLNKMFADELETTSDSTSINDDAFSNSVKSISEQRIKNLEVSQIAIVKEEGEKYLLLLELRVRMPSIKEALDNVQH
jgi:hypothetical protein